jgi:hypothetical protein
MKTPKMLVIFESLIGYLKNEKINNILYKAIPHIYHTVPSEEDLYALFLNNARLVRRDLSVSINNSHQMEICERRKRGVKKATKNGLAIKQSVDYHGFMKIVKELLITKYDVEATHTAAEISLLAERFPEHIKLFIVHLRDAIVGGVIIYESSNVAHAQYIASTEEGKKAGALDMLFDNLISDQYRNKRFFDFGISTEQNGRFLNAGLITQKEEFGARAVAYDTYQLDIL